MQIYEVALTKTTPIGPGPIFTLATGTTIRPSIREIGIFIAPTAVASIVGIGRPAAVGSGTTTGVFGQPLDPNDPASTCGLISSYATTQPTTPAAFTRRIDFPATVGSGVIWTWPSNTFKVNVNSNLCIWQISSAAASYDVYVVWEE